MSYLFITDEFLEKMYDHCDKVTLDWVINDMKTNGRFIQINGHTCNFDLNNANDMNDCIKTFLGNDNFDNILNVINSPYDGKYDVYVVWDITDFINCKSGKDFHIAKAILAVFIALKGVIIYNGKLIDKQTLDNI